MLAVGKLNGPTSTRSPYSPRGLKPSQLFFGYLREVRAQPSLQISRFEDVQSYVTTLCGVYGYQKVAVIPFTGFLAPNF